MYEVAKTFALADYVGEMTARKSCVYGSHKHLLLPLDALEEHTIAP